MIGLRYLCYKAGYFIDWCRCVNSLASCEDAPCQVGVLERMLSKENYFKSGTGGGSATTGPLALVVEWEDMMEWLDAVLESLLESLLLTTNHARWLLTISAILHVMVT
jgi:hypothetical protein